MLRRVFLATVLAMAMTGFTAAAMADCGACHAKDKACKCDKCKECDKCKDGKCAECDKECCRKADAH